MQPGNAQEYFHCYGELSSAVQYYAATYVDVTEHSIKKDVSHLIQNSRGDRKKLILFFPLGKQAHFRNMMILN